MNRLLLSSLCLILFACAAPSEEEEQSTGAAAATSRSDAASFAGEFVVVGGDGARIQIVVTRDTPSPDGEGRSWGTVVALRQGELSFRDRPPFFLLGEREQCSSLATGAVSRLRICHETKLEGGVLTHTVRAREATLLVSQGSSVAVQTLARRGDRLRYTYRIDGRTEEDLELAPIDPTGP